jgi:hypothetical protein
MNISFLSVDSLFNLYMVIVHYKKTLMLWWSFLDDASVELFVIINHGAGCWVNHYLKHLITQIFIFTLLLIFKFFLWLASIKAQFFFGSLFFKSCMWIKGGKNSMSLYNWVLMLNDWFCHHKPCDYSYQICPSLLIWKPPCAGSNLARFVNRTTEILTRSRPRSGRKIDFRKMEGKKNAWSRAWI